MIEITDVRDLTPGEQYREAVIEQIMAQQLSTKEMLRTAFDEGFYYGYKRKEEEIEV